MSLPNESAPPRPAFPDVRDGCVRCALIGDVVGKPGMRVAVEAAKWLRSYAKADVLVVNAENAADGTGLQVKQFERLLQAGYDCVTLGDHVYRKREIIPVLERSDRLVRPGNFPASAPGRGLTVIELSAELRIAVLSLMGRVYMRPVDCPFAALDRLLQTPDLPPVRLLDFHAEATSDKQAMGWYADGRLSAVLGTHTHVATADEQILPGGTGYHSDVGMSGPFKSILGREVEPVLRSTTTFEPCAFHVATEDVRVSGTYIDVNRESGRCEAIARLQWREAELTAWRTAAAEVRRAGL